MSVDVQHDPASAAALEIELWSDVVCPWCWIGETRLHRALTQAGIAADTRVTMRAFQLDPQMQGRRGVIDYLADKYAVSPEQARTMAAGPAAQAAELGLTINNDRALVVNTQLAHQLIAFARSFGRDTDLATRLHRAHFTDGADVSDIATLVRTAGNVGLDETEAERALQTGAFAPAVADDLQHAARIGVRGVPFFVLAGRFAVSGAQPTETLLAAIRKAQDAMAVG